MALIKFSCNALVKLASSTGKLTAASAFRGLHRAHQMLVECHKLASTVSYSREIC